MTLNTGHNAAFYDNMLVLTTNNVHIKFEISPFPKT